MAYLNCDCGGDKFRNIVKLKGLQTGAVVSEVAGYACEKCGKPADTGYLRKLSELKDKKDELDRLKEEIGETEARKATGTKPAKQVPSAP